MDAALELFAANRISAVSMREIRIAAGQRNAAAVQHHFGSMDGLLRALVNRELPRLTERRKALLDEAHAADDDDIWSVAAVWALPYAQLATGDETERQAVRLFSHLHDDVSFTLEQIAELVYDPTTDDALTLLTKRMGKRLPLDVLNERVQIATNSFVHAAAVRASGRVVGVSDEVFARVLVDMFYGSLVAPMSGT